MHDVCSKFASSAGAWPLYVAVAIYYQLYGSSDRSSDRCYLTPPRRWFRRLFCVTWTNATHFSIWHHGRSAEPVAVCTECSCAVGFRRSRLWPHNAGARGAALASGSASGGFQVCHPGLLVTVRHGSSILSRRLLAALWRRLSSAAFCQLKDVVRQIYSSYGDRCFAAAGPRMWNKQPSSSSETNWHKLWTV